MSVTVANTFASVVQCHQIHSLTYKKQRQWTTVQIEFNYCWNDLRGGDVGPIENGRSVDTEPGYTSIWKQIQTDVGEPARSIVWTEVVVASIFSTRFHTSYGHQVFPQLIRNELDEFKLNDYHSKLPQTWASLRWPSGPDKLRFQCEICALGA